MRTRATSIAKVGTLLTAGMLASAACAGGTGSSGSSATSASAPSAAVAAAPSGTLTPTQAALLDGEPWIVFTWAPDQGRGLYMVRPDGTDAHEIGLDLPGEPQVPDWSPDGRLIAFDLQVSDGVHEIWSSNANGTDPHRVVACEAAPCVEVGSPAWSPDGRQLLFGRRTNATGATGDHRGDRLTIEVFDLATQTSRVIAAAPPPGAEYVEWSGARWSPDGRQVVFTINRYPMPPTDENRLGSSIAVVKSDGSEVDAPRILTEPGLGGSYPDWSPDSQRIVFFAYGPGQFQQTTNPTNLYTVHPDGSELTQITHYGENDDRATEPTWTPDGSRIIFAFFKRNPSDPFDRHVAFIDPDGSDMTVLDRFASHPRLRPTP